MNIADRPRLYAEIKRVLKPGGRLALQDVTQGEGGDVIYPVVWADHPAMSFLRTAEETRALLEAAGFRVRAWHDVSDQAVAEAEAEKARAAAASAPRPLLGVHLIVGPSFPEKMRNGQRNQAERRIRLINAVVEKP